MNTSPGDVDAIEKYYEYDNISDSFKYTEGITSSVKGLFTLTGITLIACFIGFLGNGYIIWLLGFQIKRNQFTTFVLNLAFADIGFLTSIIIYYTDEFFNFLQSIIFFYIFVSFTHIMYINAHLLLTAISIDRCVAVLFPIWHRCARPNHLSSTICVLFWFSSFLLGGIINIMKLTNSFRNHKLFPLPFLVTAIVCLPLITLSTAILFIKVCLKPKQKKQGQLLLIILITLLCYLILAFPLNACIVILFFSTTEPDLQLLAGILLCSCLSSSINPVIYFLIGRKKKTQPKESMKVILQKVFKEN